MTVRAEKPSVNLREKLAELDKPTGIAGEAMLRAETPQEQFNLIGAGRRNLIINGDMQVAQRGTTFTRSANGWGVYGSVDRWGIYYNHTVVTQNSGLVDGSYQYYVSVDNDGTAPDNHFIYQKIETGSRIVSGKSVTLSFMAKSSNETVLKVRGRFYDSATESNAVDSGQKTFHLSSSWQRFEYTFTPVDTSANMTRDFLLLFDTDISSDTVNDIYDLTNVQLELGKVATPFEHRSYGEELALCQRYYQRYETAGTPQNYVVLGSGHNATSSNSYVVNFFPGGTMRSSPSVSNSSVSNSFRWFAASTNGLTSTIPNKELISPNSMSMGNNSQTVTAGQGIVLWMTGTGAYVQYDAEL